MVEIGIAKDWIENDRWPHCSKCGAEMVLIRGLSAIGDIKMCSKPDCPNGIYRDAEKQIPGTKIAKKYEELDLEDVQKKISEMVLQFRNV